MKHRNNPVLSYSMLKRKTNRLGYIPSLLAVKRIYILAIDETIGEIFKLKTKISHLQCKMY